MIDDDSKGNDGDDDDDYDGITRLHSTPCDISVMVVVFA